MYSHRLFYDALAGLCPSPSDLLFKAEGDIEIIVVLDGYLADPIDDPRVHYIHRGEPFGMRARINTAAALAKGEFLLKIDAPLHCRPGIRREALRRLRSELGRDP